MDRFHDFSSKLRGPLAHSSVAAYIRWQRAVRMAVSNGEAPPSFPSDLGPLSLNLDLTTACNFACDHCIDWDSLNSPVRHDIAKLQDSLRELARRGLRSVILIGGGEPTLHPDFVGMVRFLKEELKLQVSIVSNGSRNPLIAEAAAYMGEGDWVRLSLDSGTDETFQAMHKPKSGISLAECCTSAEKIRKANPKITLGFSFVITWKGSQREEANLIENIDEMAQAAELAARNGFEYISFKPFLNRTNEGAEVLQADEVQGADKIRAGLTAARECTSSYAGFRVIESLNLQVLLAGSWPTLTRQPKICHMQAFRQVISPLGVFNCPAHRGVDRARIGSPDSWIGEDGPKGTTQFLESFDASKECAEVVCLYNSVNHFLEAAIEADEDWEFLPDIEDCFL
ncbi:MAG: radical SAM protein [Planctomycetota bacterium]|jgi:pyruvate-formate lyase-activating enzyme|nr:radical SAM protein [Planctomycetota bacterium]